MSEKIKSILSKLFQVLNSSPSELLHGRRVQWDFGRFNDAMKFRDSTSLFQPNIDPNQVARWLRAVFLIATISLIVGFFCSIFQFPWLQNGKSQMTYYQVGLKNDPSHLFSKKVIHLDGIKIQGIMITKDQPDNAQGYVIFDIDGKNIGPIEVGETFGKGLFLQSITNNSATITFQGQKSTIYLNSSESNVPNNKVVSK
ncbi:hypothetical protein [Polynucleobacter kasalickyi]|uniref:Uncharacterized protein n=1 Tax=Polynucleobacter kasalickyi TaxID=1938817 RepID=A0A1W1YW69_9BURK|nr:hypothetical protein [Polynucleobacter kasalickyi]SMC40363.1 hypothetical protein SAMN06296008_1041 [Polynucleobacter kasalickyi]